jgi:hypothetical protein
MQKFLESLPWYVKVPAAVCGAVLAHYADKLPDWVEPYAIMGGVGLFLWVAVSFVWHGISAWRVHRGRGSLVLEPWHIIALGLVIAVGGLLWQWKYKPPADPQIAELRSQVEALIKTRSTTPEPVTKAAADKSILRERGYLKDEKEDLGAKLRKISSSIHSTGDEILTKAEVAINGSYWERADANVAPEIQRIGDIRSLTIEMHKSLYDGLIDKEREFREELNAVLFPKEPFTEFQIAANDFHNGLAVWMKLRDSADNAARNELHRLVLASRMSFGVTRDRFAHWLSQRLEIVDRARRDLGK